MTQKHPAKPGTVVHPGGKGWPFRSFCAVRGSAAAVMRQTTPRKRRVSPTERRPSIGSMGAETQLIRHRHPAARKRKAAASWSTRAAR